MTEQFTQLDYISPLGNHCRLTRCNTCRMGVSFARIGEYDEAIAAWKRRHPCNAAPTEPCGPPEGE